jgi:hypothetical protein
MRCSVFGRMLRKGMRPFFVLSKRAICAATRRRELTPHFATMPRAVSPGDTFASSDAAAAFRAGFAQKQIGRRTSQAQHVSDIG